MEYTSRKRTKETTQLLNKYVYKFHDEEKQETHLFFVFGRKWKH